MHNVELKVEGRAQHGSRPPVAGRSLMAKEGQWVRALAPGEVRLVHLDAGPPSGNWATSSTTRAQRGLSIPLAGRRPHNAASP